jgi:prepilin-type N-terminal cleavage/methylation domain-containing protein
MKSQIISKNKGFTPTPTLGNNKSKLASGFTLIEIIIVMIIISSFLLIGSFVNQEIYNQKSLFQEKLLLITILQKVRNKAINNIHESNHGLYIDNSNYIIFRKFPYNQFDLTNDIIPKNNNFAITASLDLINNNNQIEIIFNQLSGEPANTGQIILSDGIKQEYINIKKGGLIDW